MSPLPVMFSHATGLSKLMQGAKADPTTREAETFLFRIHRVPVAKVATGVMDDAGLNPFCNPFVFFLVAADEWDEPGPELTGPLTYEGALAVARSFTETFNRLTNYGAF